MIELQFINAEGAKMDAINNEYMTLVAIDGLHGVDNEMSSSTSPYFDGDYVNHIRTNPRSIAMTYHLTAPIPEALRYFNSIVKSKQKATLVETQEDGKKIKIEGIVTVPPYSRWSNSVAVQIQLYCSKPYWKDAENFIQEITSIIDMHYFPYESEADLLADNGGLGFPEEGIPFGEIDNNRVRGIMNDGDVPIGARITIVAFGNATNPTITNITTGDWLKVNISLVGGDWIEINTERGEKEIRSNRAEATWDSITYNGNDWLQLATGYNELASTTAVEAEDDNIYFAVEYSRGWQ